jgi:subtilisin family serine protease
MKVKRLFSLLVVIALLSTPLSHPVQSHTYTRIDPLFLWQVKQSKSLIPVVIELVSLPGIEYWVEHQVVPMSGTNTPPTPLLEFIPDYQKRLLNQQDQVLSWINRKSISFIPKHHLTLTLNAITGDIKGRDLETLSNCPFVYKIHDSRQTLEPIRFLGSKSSGVDHAWAGLTDYGLPPLSGKNKVIGVMDTGIDKSHPEFAGIGKIKGGYNVADGNDDLTDDSSHGTMVAGIAAGQGSVDEKQGRGMAYDANIRIYKIFSKNSSAPADVLGALEKVVEDRCDVLNCSFGGSSSDFSTGDTAFHRSFRNADKAGTLVVAGAGNSGSRRKEVPWPILSPSIIDTVISAGGTDDRKEVPFLTVHENERPDRTFQAIYTPYSPTINSAVLEQGVVDCGYGSKEEISSLVLTKKVALIQRGPYKNSISFRDKLENAGQAGASGVIFYNNQPHQNIACVILKPGEDKQAAKSLLPSISLSKEDGESIKKIMTNECTFRIDNRQYSTIANFSSMGLSGDSVLKPEITAPSTQIVSTVPGGKYGNSSGTSFSTPMISGMCTLLKEARPLWTHQQIKSALMNTADIMINPFNQLPITFTLQGAGSARLDQALKTPAFLEPRAVISSRTPSEFTQSVQVTNATDKEQVFELSAEFFHLNQETVPFTITFDRGEVKVGKGEQSTFTFTITKSKEPILQNRYEGIINVGTQLHIPLICYRDAAQKVEESISNIRISRESLDLTKQNPLRSTPVQISFSLNAGDISSRVNKDYTSYTSLNYGSVDVYVADDSGEIWGKIESFSNIMVGEYTFLWDGTNVGSQLFLPKGPFLLYFTMNLREQKDKDTTTNIYGPFTKTFQVTASDIPELITGSLSALKTVHGNDILKLGLRLNKLPPYMVSEGDITKIEFLLYYGPGQSIIYKKSELLGFLADESVAEIVVLTDTEGMLKVSISSPGISPAKVDELPFLQFEFTTGSKGDITFYTRSFLIQTTNQKSHRVKAYEVGCKISSRDFLLCDLNKDKFVDQKDADLFMESFGTRADEEGYDEKSDFNQDRRIDALDLIILSREME